MSHHRHSLLAVLGAAAAVALAAAATERPAQMLGFMAENAQWTAGALPEPGYGYYGLSSDGAGGITPASPVGTNEWAVSAGVWANGRLYGYSQNQGSWTQYTLHFHAVDPGDQWRVVRQAQWTYRYSQAESQESQRAVDIPSAMAYDPVHDKVYAATHRFGNSDANTHLCEVDTLTGLMTVVADIPFMRTMAADATGELYGVTLDGNLNRISPADGSLAVVGPMGYWGVRDADISYGATVDYRTGRMYWAFFGYASERDRNYSQNGVNIMMGVDLATGEGTRLWDIPDGIRLSALNVPNAHPAAPDNVYDLSFGPSEAGSSEGAVSFTVPTVTVDQRPLAGQVAVDVWLDGAKAVDRVAAQPGNEFSASLGSLTDGDHTVIVTLVGADGHAGRANRATAYFGLDAPAAPSGLVATVADPAELTTVSLAWQAPSLTARGAALADDAQLAYRVVRMPAGVVVAEGCEDTSLTDVVTEPFSLVYYTVQAYLADDPDRLSAKARSPKVRVGAPLEVPFTETFDSQEAFDAFTVIDANGDAPDAAWEDPCWKYDSQYGAAFYMGAAGGADDWLVLPKLALDPAKLYTLQFRYYGYYGYGNDFSVRLGPAPTVEALQDGGVAVADFAGAVSTMQQTLRSGPLTFAPRTAADRYLAIHHTSQNYEHLSIDDIVIQEAGSSAVPAAVTGLAAQADADGRAVLTFTVPTLTAGGAQMQGKVNVAIYRGADSAQPVDNLNGLVRGSSQTWTDPESPAGVVTYRVVTSNSHGTGLEASVTIDLGRGVPGQVSGVRATLVNPGQVRVDWEPSVAQQDDKGRPVDLASVRYLVYKPVPNDLGVTEYRLVGRDLKECTWVDDDPLAGLGDGAQKTVMYYVAAVNADGESVAAPSTYVYAGESYPLPFAESWTNHEQNTAPWVKNVNQGATWYMVSTGYDPYAPGQDGMGLLSCEADLDVPQGLGGYASPRMDLTQVQDPVLTFHYYTSDAYTDAITLWVAVDRGDGLLHYVGDPLQARSDVKGWREVSLSLAEHADCPRASVVFVARVAQGMSLHLDNMAVTGSPRKDAAELAFTGLSGGQEVCAGKAYTMMFTVTNVGGQCSPAATVTYTDGARGSVTIPPLEAGQSVTGALDASIPADAPLGWRTLTAAIATNGGNPGNDAFSRMVRVVPDGPNLPWVTDLTATADQSGEVALRWGVPNRASRAVTVLEGFEDYEPFAIADLGPWTPVDLDGGVPFKFQNQSGNIDWPNNGAAQAFMAFCPAEVDALLPIAPHEGNQMAVSWGSTAAAGNDDWLVSGPLDGEPQLMSAWVCGVEDAEMMDVLASPVDDTLDPAAFTSVLPGGMPVAAPKEWTLMHFSLPEGTARMAFRYTGHHQTALMLDDIQYTGYPATRPAGYDVYRDGVLLNPGTRVPADQRVFYDIPDHAGTFTYTVRPWWGTSKYPGADSNAATVTLASGIDAVGTDSVAAGTIVVARDGLGAIVVTGARGQGLSVYAADGRLLRRVAAAGEAERIGGLPSGVIVVRAAAGHAVKVML